MLPHTYAYAASYAAAYICACCVRPAYHLLFARSIEAFLSIFVHMHVYACICMNSHELSRIAYFTRSSTGATLHIFSQALFGSNASGPLSLCNIGNTRGGFPSGCCTDLWRRLSDSLLRGFRSRNCLEDGLLRGWGYFEKRFQGVVSSLNSTIKWRQTAGQECEARY